MIQLFVFICSASIFVFYLLKNYSVSYYDELNYYNLSLFLKSTGLFGLEDPLRTYLYPLMIAITAIFTDGTIETTKVIFSILQYSFYVYTIVSIAKSSFQYSNSKIVYITVLAFGLMNPYLVQATTLFLTDTLATCFVVLAFKYLVTTDLNRWKNGLFMFMYLYGAVMIRPSSAIFIGIFGLIGLYKWFTDKDLKATKILVSAVLLLVIFAPQIHMNVTKFDHFTPLIHQNLYEQQTEWAVENLKYGTLIMENEDPRLYYLTPFEIEKGKTMFDIIFDQPGAFITIFASHVFGLFDWGYVDSYITSLDAQDRILPTILLYLLWFVMMIGIIPMYRINRFLSISILFTGMLYMLFMGTTCVESRFGYPLYLFMLFFAGTGVQYIIKNRYNVKTLSILTSTFVCITAILLYASYLIDMTTSRIQW